MLTGGLATRLQPRMATAQRRVAGKGQFAAGAEDAHAVIGPGRAAADAHIADPLEAAGIDVYASDSPASTLMRLEYPTANVDERILSVKAVADPIEPRHIEGLEAHTMLITASIRGEVAPATVQAMKVRCQRLALDVQGFVRVVTPEGRLAYQAWPEREQVLGQIDILKTDAVEAEFLTGTADIREAAHMLSAIGPREIVLTHKDGLLVLADGSYHEAPFKPAELRGRSGRGDTCVGSYASRRIGADPAEATRWRMRGASSISVTFSSLSAQTAAASRPI